MIRGAGVVADEHLSQTVGGAQDVPIPSLHRLRGAVLGVSDRPTLPRLVLLVPLVAIDFANSVPLLEPRVSPRERRDVDLLREDLTTTAQDTASVLRRGHDRTPLAAFRECGLHPARTAPWKVAGVARIGVVDRW